MDRELSPAEEEGWRQYWDGWCICPPCIEEELESSARYYTSKNIPFTKRWPVPADYARPIGEASSEYIGDKCLKCGKLPPLLLTWKTQLYPVSS